MPTLKDQLLARMEQNKKDRATHQETIESLDRGLIYLQGQLDLVEQMLAAEAAQAKAKAEALAAQAKTEAEDLASKAKAEVVKLVTEAETAFSSDSTPTSDTGSDATSATQSD
jgi:uncharacterized protein (DUF3084 family)